jgi:hypothetical protein
MLGRHKNTVDTATKIAALRLIFSPLSVWAGRARSRASSGPCKDYVQEVIVKNAISRGFA